MNQLPTIIAETDLSKALSSYNAAGRLFQNGSGSSGLGEKYVVFYINERLFAVSAVKVVEVFHLPPAITPLPNTPEWIIGVANLRGEIISVIDLYRLHSGKSSNVAPKSKLIVFRSPRKGISIAFTVDKLSEIVTLPKDKITFADQENPAFTIGTAVYKSKTLTLIDMEKIVNAPRFDDFRVQ